MARSRNHANYVNVTLPYTQSSYSTQHYQSSPVLPSSRRTPHSQQEHGYYSAEGNWHYFSRGNMQRPTGQVHNPHNQPSGSYSRQPHEESSCETAQFYIQPSQGDPVPPSPSPVFSPTHSETHVSHPEYDQPRPDSTPGYPEIDPPRAEFSPPHPESSIEFNLPPPEYDTEDIPPPIPPRNRTPSSSLNSGYMCSVSTGRVSPNWSGPPSSITQQTRQQLFASNSQQSSRSLDYQNIIIDKERQLGQGAYGAVFHANCDQLACAAKVMHRALSAPGNLGVEAALEKFKVEINLLSAIRHPNIVQYLTTTLEPSTGNPVLLMELCDESLTNYLERSPPPYHEQLNICVDVSLALAYLHLNALLHRDLSSNNVLLSRGKAKITDFGMSKLVEFQPTTVCPGNPVYMPPEALNDPPSYTDKLDVFSFGVLMVQIMTQKFPDPSNRFRAESVPVSEQFPTGQVLKPIPEVKRRANHLKLIEGSHSLKPVAERCMADKEGQRPFTHKLSNDLTGMRTKPNFTQSLNLDRRAKTESHVGKHHRTRELEQHNQALQMKLEQATIQIQNLQDTRDTLVLTREQMRKQTKIAEEEKQKYEQKKREVEKLKAESNDHQELLAVFQNTLDQNTQERRVLEARIRELEEKLKRTEMTVEERDRVVREQDEQIRALKKGTSGSRGWVDLGDNSASGGTRELGGRDSITRIRWEVVERAPVDMSAGSAVTIGEDVYVVSDNSKTVYCYNSERNWSALPECNCTAFSLTTVDRTLVAVGGLDNGYSHKLYSYDPQSKTWGDGVYPPMPTARREPVTLSTVQYLIVAGGFSGVRSLDVVEVLMISEKAWITCTNTLPHVLFGGTMAFCDNNLYLAPFNVDSVSCQQMLLTCPLPDLFRPLKKKFFNKYPGHWQRLKDLPAPHGSIVTVDGRILAIGGKSSQNTATSASSGVWEFVRSSGTWRLVSHMNVERWTPIVATLPRNRIIVVGGQAKWKKINSVELAHL